ncbi:MAG TPA: hypothetical protein VF591_25370 [Pyrinomonadaceae bacterium]|jgi:hypothetical protein
MLRMFGVDVGRAAGRGRPFAWLLAAPALCHVGDKQEHLNVFIVGNERTGLRTKAFGLARSEELVEVVEGVLNDQPPSQK